MGNFVLWIILFKIDPNLFIRKLRAPVFANKQIWIDFEKYKAPNGAQPVFSLAVRTHRAQGAPERVLENILSTDAPQCRPAAHRNWPTSKVKTGASAGRSGRFRRAFAKKSIQR